MASECVVTVKQEPAELSEEDENEGSAPGQQNHPEFVNIKMEIEVEVPDIRIKTDLEEAQSSPAHDRRGSWHLPITDEATQSSKYIEVTVKQELEDSAELDSATDDTSCLQPASSTNENHDFASTYSGRRYFCTVCKKKFANPGNVQRHMLLHNRETFKCSNCDEQFANKMKLDRHMLHKHTDPTERVHACDVCEKKFKSSSNLMQHKKIHLDVKPFVCPLCHKSFSFKTNLRKHQGKSRCKVSTGEPLKCSVCNKIFQKEYLLKSHLRRHDTERPFSCDQCSMNFKYKSTLIRHLQLHDGVKPYSCPYCEKSFTHSGLLKPHLRVHTGEKPYQCPICTKSFGHKHNMQRHAQRHKKIKHLVCDICHKQFPRESRLKYHMKTHTNEKHFACNICPKRFSHKHNVLRHYTRKHPGQTYNCTETDASVALKVWDTIKSKYYEDEAEEILG